MASPSIPTHQIAILTSSSGSLHLSPSSPVRSPQSGEALVKTSSVAINPVDAKMLDYYPVPNAVHGYDFSGTIVALGEDCPAHLAVGDRVAGFVHGMNAVLPEVGAFAEYVAASADLLLKIPENMGFDEAAGIGLGLFTAGMGIWGELKVEAKLGGRKAGEEEEEEEEEEEKRDLGFVLVAGGSTATGTRAIQLLKSVGLRPIATCSKANAELARRFGAEEAFDYNDPECAAQIRDYTENSLAFAFDCVCAADTTQLCYAAMGRAGGRYATVEPFRTAITETRPLTIEPSWLLALTVFGRKVDIDGEYSRDAKPEDREFAAELTRGAQALLDQGKFDTHPIKVMPGGWDGVLDGVDLIRKQAMSGQKLVYPVGA